MPPSNDDLIQYARDFLKDLENDHIDDVEQWKFQRSKLAIMGYPLVNDEREVELVIRTIRKAVYPSRSGGIA